MLETIILYAQSVMRLQRKTKDTILLYNPEIKNRTHNQGAFWGNVIKYGKFKLHTGTNKRYYVSPSKKYLWAFYRLDLIRLFLGERQYSRSALISEAVVLFVNYFEELMIKKKSTIPPLNIMIDIIAGRSSIKDYTEYKRWVEAEASLIEILKQEPFYHPLRFKELDIDNYKEFFDEQWGTILQLAKEVKKGNKINKSYLPVITLIKRLMIYLENHIENKEN